MTRKLSRVGLILKNRYEKRCTFEDALEAMAEVFLEKLDPERRAEKVAQRALSRRKTKPEKTKLPVSKISVPSEIKLQALRRDRNQCRHISRGERCRVKKRVDIFPVRAFNCSREQSPGLQDVATLCQRHAKSPSV